MLLTAFQSTGDWVVVFLPASLSCLESFGRAVSLEIIPKNLRCCLVSLAAKLHFKLELMI